jgi:hypothetical protein
MCILTPPKKKVKSHHTIYNGDQIKMLSVLAYDTCRKLFSHFVYDNVLAVDGGHPAGCLLGAGKKKAQTPSFAS